jgi:hypothetical protein
MIELLDGSLQPSHICRLSVKRRPCDSFRKIDLGSCHKSGEIHSQVCGLCLLPENPRIVANLSFMSLASSFAAFSFS